ncbi:MAG: protease pro-enzyme activation domain-containing protein [Terriglobales bacterium]
MPRSALLTLLFCCAAASWAETSAPSPSPAPRSIITGPIDESRLVTLRGNTTAAARHANNDRGAVADDLVFDHLLLTLQPPPESEARLEKLIDEMHDQKSVEFHRWLTAQQLGDRFGLAQKDRETIQTWLESHGFSVNRVYHNGLVIDFAGTAAQIREAFHTEVHNLVLPNGAKHIANMHDPQIPAALAPAIAGIASLHDFFPRSHAIRLGPVSYDAATQQWHPHFNVKTKGQTFHAVGPYDFDTIYNVLPLWQRGFTGKGVTIALVEDSNLAHESDWNDFRNVFGLKDFKDGNFQQIYPGCKNPGQNGDEIEAALDVEWASASAPDASIELSACANSRTVSGLDLAILNLLDLEPPDIISDSYGLCETITGQAEIALENREAQIATALGTTFFIAQGDTGADECAPVESTPYSTLGINSGDNTASAYAVDVGGTDFMAQYNQDVNGIPVSDYWSPTNDPRTLASALSYIPEIPWNDGCTSQLIYSDPVFGSYTQSYGPSGFCNSTLGRSYLFRYAESGSGGPSTCFTGVPSIPGVVSGTCQGNPKPSYQTGVPGIPRDGLRDQPDLSLFSATGIWGSFLVECMSDAKEFGAPCTARNDALLEGGGGTSFASPAMAGIQALIDQKYGKQGNANYVYYALAARQFDQQGAKACNASQTTGKLPAPSCIFNDVTRGDMDIPCGLDSKGISYNCYGEGRKIIGELSTSTSEGEPAYPATVGYDLATGLGSVNATRLFEAWPHGSQSGK